MEHNAPHPGEDRNGLTRSKELETILLNTEPEVDYEYFAAAVVQAMLGDALKVLRSADLWALVQEGGSSEAAPIKGDWRNAS